MNTLLLAGLPLVVGGGILVLLLVMARIMPGMEKKGKAAQELATAVTVPPRGPEYIRLAAKRIAAYRLGIIVLVGLAVLTLLEFFASQLNSLVLMFVFALLKAALIMYFFMHIYNVWTEEEAH